MAAADQRRKNTLTYKLWRSAIAIKQKAVQLHKTIYICARKQSSVSMFLSVSHAQNVFYIVFTCRRKIGMANRSRSCKIPEMQASLAAWVRDQHAAKVCVNGEMIKMQGHRILNGISGVLPPEKLLSLNFFSGWLSKFEKHWDLKVF